MQLFDIKFTINLESNLWYNFLTADPNFPDQKVRSKGLREPYRSDSLKVLQTLNNRFEGIAIVDYGINSYEPDDYRTVIFLYEFSNPESFNLVAQLIFDLLQLSPLVESISISLTTSRVDHFYQSYLNELYIKYSGRIPVSELLKTRFSMGSQFALDFIRAKLFEAMDSLSLKYNASNWPSNLEVKM